jgi:hypothetical protein
MTAKDTKTNKSSNKKNSDKITDKEKKKAIELLEKSLEDCC